MKTAVEWLQAEFNKWAEGKVFIPQDLLEQAKQKEKEQIKRAFEFGVADAYNFIEDEAEEYYNITFKQNK